MNPGKVFKINHGDANRNKGLGMKRMPAIPLNTEAGPAFATGAAACHLDIGWGNTRGAPAGWVHFPPWWGDIKLLYNWYIHIYIYIIINHGKLSCRVVAGSSLDDKTMNLIRIGCFGQITRGYWTVWMSNGNRIVFSSHVRFVGTLDQSELGWQRCQILQKNHGEPLLFKDLYRYRGGQGIIRAANMQCSASDSQLENSCRVFSGFIIGVTRSWVTSRNFSTLIWSLKSVVSLCHLLSVELFQTFGLFCMLYQRHMVTWNLDFFTSGKRWLWNLRMATSKFVLHQFEERRTSLQAPRSGAATGIELRNLQL